MSQTPPTLLDSEQSPAQRTLYLEIPLGNWPPVTGVYFSGRMYELQPCVPQPAHFTSMATGFEWECPAKELKISRSIGPGSFFRYAS